MTNSHEFSSQTGFTLNTQGLSYQDLNTRGSSDHREARISQDSGPQGFSAASTTPRTTSNSSSSPELLHGNRQAVKKYQEKKRREEEDLNRRHEEAKARNKELKEQLKEKSAKFNKLVNFFK